MIIWHVCTIHGESEEDWRFSATEHPNKDVAVWSHARALPDSLQPPVRTLVAKQDDGAPQEWALAQLHDEVRRAVRNAYGAAAIHCTHHHLDDEEWFHVTCFDHVLDTKGRHYPYTNEDNFTIEEEHLPVEIATTKMCRLCGYLIWDIPEAYHD